jgi:hypothetical protein
MDLSAAVIAQEVVDLGEGIGQILAAGPVGAAQGLARVGIVEVQQPFGGRRNIG